MSDAAALPATGFDGAPPTLGPGDADIVAGNRTIHAELLDVVTLRRA